MTAIKDAFQRANLDRLRRVLAENSKNRWRDRETPRTTIYVATTDYVNRDEDGSYINPHLYRVPITISGNGDRS